MFQIKSRFSGEVCFECELSAEVADKSYGVQLGFAIKKAVKADANLSGANLSGANLSVAYLSDANLSGANLARAYLSGANLSGANLSGAYLSGADLARANLAGADLSDADLSDANLSGANLSGANLARAYLSGANLSGAYLAGADIIDAGQRSDGYRFIGYIRDGLRIMAGCRDFTILEAREHWRNTRGGTPLGDETMVILNHIEAVARIRKMTGDA